MAIMATAAQDQSAESSEPKILPWFGGRKHTIHRHHIDTTMHRINYGKFGWEVVVRTDAFTGDITCFVSTRKSATQDRVTYADGTLGFAFDTYVDPNTTWFRADDNPAQPLNSVYPTLYARGQVVPPRSLDNLTKSTVLIPMESVEGADHVKIRIDDKARPRTFRLIGFKQALATAQASGCTDGHYVRQPFPHQNLF